MEKCYTVAETVKLTGVKSYVLRYWEDELSLPIRRNELGHRCYTQASKIVTLCVLLMHSFNAAAIRSMPASLP